jgi:hypothetical protein
VAAPPALRVLGHELGVSERGEDGEHEREQEGGPDRPARYATDLADQRVDATPHHVADDKQQQQRRSDSAP